MPWCTTSFGFKRSRLTLAVVSPAYLRDRWAGFAELLSRNVRDDGRGGSLVPLLLADCEVPDVLAQHAMLDCRTPPQREASAARIREQLGRPEPPIEPVACPYPGMQPFTAASASRFHGRVGEIKELVSRLNAGERDIYVIGPSGSGKSSLIAAGLIPRLASESRHRFAVRKVRPGERPTQRLAEALACDPDDLDDLGGAVTRLLEREACERLLVFGDAAAEPGALPLFQEALVLLWRHRSHRLLRLASYEALGEGGRSGLAVALANRADAVLHGLSLPQQRLARRIFLRLVSFGEGRPDTRRQQPRPALAASGNESADVDAVIDHLIGERMLTSDATASGEPLVDLAHEALIAGWPAFQRWLLSRRDDEQRRRLLELRAAEWAKRDRGSVGLFDAVELAEAERWIAGETARELGYSDELPRFLAASRAAIEEAERQQQLAREDRARERRAAQGERLRLRKRLARLAIIALSLFSITASVLGLVAWRERNAAERERNAAERERKTAERQLGLNEQERARALLVESHDPGEALLRLVKAVKLGVGNTVLRTLLAEARHGMWRFAVRHGGPIRSAAFSPDGARVVTASWDRTARVWDAATAAPLAGPLTHDGPVTSAAFSPDGARVVTASDDGTARVWDATTSTPLAGPLTHDDWATSVAFSPDGARVVTTSADGTARILRVLETGPLSVWVEQAQRCVVPRANAIGSSTLCPLQDHESTPSEVLAQVGSMMLAGDAATFSRVARLPRADDQRALELLDQNHAVIVRAYKMEAEDLRRAISMRLAVLDAIDDDLQHARARLGTAAPAFDADLLNQLAGFAHEELGNDTIALPLLLHARDLAPQQVDILANLAEVYFVFGRYDDFVRTATQVNRLSATPDERIAVAALGWAVVRLTHTPDGTSQEHLLRAYNEIANGASIQWIWKGTKHALKYKRVHYKDAKPIIDVLELLEQPVTDETREKLAYLVQVQRGQQR